MASRKRHEDFEDDDVIFETKRRRKELTEIEERLENLILRVGEKSQSSLESNLEGLAQVLETDLTNYKHRILKILLECVGVMPQKLTIYSTLVGLLNAKNYNFGGEFMDMLLKSFRNKLKSSDFDNALYDVIFLCDLVNCRVISAHSCLTFLETLLDCTTDDNIPQVRSDWFCYVVLCALPWVGREFYEKKPQELDDLLRMAESYIGKRRKLHVPIMRVWTSNRPHPQEEYLDCLWAQISKLRSEKWQERHIMRPYLAFDATLCDALQHNLPSIIIPSHNKSMSYPLPKVVFRMFDYTDCPEEGPVLPGAHSIERFLIEMDLSAIIRQHCLERKDCAAALVAYPRRNKIPLNYMILEVVFGQLFQLPNPPYLDVFYGVLLIELCKLQPNSMPQVLAQAAEMLYQRLDTMSVACFDRFVEWFSYHLSQFQFHWSWDEWTDCLDMDELSPKHLFVREVLSKCLRLSYHQRVMDIVPSSFAAMVPVKPHGEFRFEKENAESSPGFELAQQLMQAIRRKCSPEESLLIIKDCPPPEDMTMDESGFNPVKINVLVSVLLHLGNISFSHSLAALAKYHYALRALTEGNEDAQQCVLQNIHEHWHTHPQMVVVLVDKLLKMQIVECPAVVDWLFSEPMQSDFLSYFVWEIMKSTLIKMSKFIQKLRGELDEAQEQLERKNRDSDSDVEDENKAEKYGGVSEEVVEQLEEELDATNNEQRNLFLLIFQKLTIILTQHLVESEAEGKDYNTFWYRWVTGRMKQIFLLLHDEIWRYAETLESLLFTNDVDPHILEIFHQFSALRK